MNSFTVRSLLSYSHQVNNTRIRLSLYVYVLAHCKFYTNKTRLHCELNRLFSGLLSFCYCLCIDAGTSIIGCSENDSVSDNLFISPGSLEVGGVVSCRGNYAVTADDIDNLERMTNTTVTAKDEYGYGVNHSYTEIVGLSQVSAWDDTSQRSDRGRK